MKALTQASNGTGRIYMRMNLINDRCERFKWHRIASERILPNSDIEATRLNREITSISGKYAEGGHFLNGIICDMLSGAYYPGQNSIISGEKKYKFKEIYGFMTSREFAMLYDGFVKDRKNGPMGLYTFIYQCNRLPLEKVKLGIRELAPEFSGNHEQLTAGVMAIAKLTQTSGVTDVAALKMFLKGAPEGEVAKYMECFAYLRNNGAKFGWERELECVKTALSPDVEKLVQNHPKREKEEIRRLYNAVVSVNTQESAATNTENVAETLAVAAFKAQSTLQRISHEMSRPCVGVYILSTGFGLRAPVPSMRQFDNQYLSNQALLDKAYSRLFGEDGKNAPADLKIKRVRMEFVSQVKTKLNLGVKGLERKADQMKCSLDVASEWMNNGILDSYVYQTAYKVASGAGGIKNGSAAAKITDKIRDVCMDAGYPVVIVDHSTVRTRGHSTLKISSVADSSMGRAIAQIAARMKPPRLSNDSVKWLSVLNNWNVGDLMTDGKAPSIVGFNLYSGIEFKSAGGARKSNWLPTDDKAFYVGRSWNEDNVSSKETLNSISMDEDFQIKNTNVTSDYWRYFRNKYSAFESQQRLDWAKKLRNVVLFDVDGTLIEAKQSYDIGLRKGFEKIIEMLKEQKVRVSMEEIGSAYQKVRRESKEKFYDFGRYRDMEIRFYSMLLKLPGKVSNNEQIIATLRTVAQKAYGEYIAERNARSRIYPEAIETLRKLNEQGYDVVLMTDRRDSEVQSILQMRDADGTPIEKYVKGAIVTNDLVSITDTDVPICRLGLPKEIPAYQKVTDVIRPIMMIGDSVRHDVEPVEAFGIEAVRVKSGHGFEKVFEALEKRSEEKS
jgi:FMN phosphatase YigB (HAD superfamily)